MLRFIATALLLPMAALTALADEGDPFMGTYRGAFTGSDWADTAIAVDVVAEGDGNYALVFHIGEAHARIVIPGRADDPEEPAEVTAAAEADLGPGLGGVYAIDARIHDEVLEGAFAGATQAEFRLDRVVIVPPALGAAPPEGAIVLFDGTNIQDWRRWPEQWCVTSGGAMEVCGSNLVTRAEFGSARYHIEFRTPFLPHARGQSRGNSGVYVHGRYEIQVLDSFGQEARDDYCGGIYSIAAPRVNATLPPLQWQTYEIEFHAPRFNEDGEKTGNARITVKHNGILVHDDLELPHATPGGVTMDEGPLGPLLLQDHGARVRFRNIWVEPLD